MMAGENVAASAQAVMGAVVAVAARSVATGLKADQKAVAMDETLSAANVLPNHAVPSHAIQHHVLVNVLKVSVKNAPQASSATMRRVKKTVSHVSPAKAVVPSARAANAVNGVQSAASACRVMPPSKTWPWPTKPPWLQPWASRLVMQASQARTAPRKMQGVTSVVSAVAAVTSVVTNAWVQAMQHQLRKTPI